MAKQNSRRDRIIELARTELGERRTELCNLKQCQVTFMTFAATATGALLGIVGSWSQNRETHNFFLAPLIIVLPFWWIFFDKATTITRIVGYVRHLEDIVVKGSVPAGFRPWENALGKYRTEQAALWHRFGQRQASKERLGRVLVAVVILRTTQKYWVLAYWTFALLSLVCLLLGISEHSVLGWAAIALVLASAFGNAQRLYHLLEGYNSYEANYQMWKKLMRAK